MDMATESVARKLRMNQFDSDPDNSFAQFAKHNAFGKAIGYQYIASSSREG